MGVLQQGAVICQTEGCAGVPGSTAGGTLSVLGGRVEGSLSSFPKTHDGVTRPQVS